MVRSEVRKELGIPPKRKQAAAEVSTSEQTTEEAPEELPVSEETPAISLSQDLRLRLDLPVLPSGRYTAAPEGEEVEVGRVMDGWSTTRSYMVAAVKGDKGILAVRNLGMGQWFRIKFYPNFAYWNLDKGQLQSLGADFYKSRPAYERMEIQAPGLFQLLSRLEIEAKPKTRAKSLLDRMKAASFEAIHKAFSYLQ